MGLIVSANSFLNHPRWLDLQIVTRTLEQLATVCLVWRGLPTRASFAGTAWAKAHRHIICSFTQLETDLSTTPNLGVPSI